MCSTARRGPPGTVGVGPAGARPGPRTAPQFLRIRPRYRRDQELCVILAVFSDEVRKDGKLPLVLLIHDPDYRDHLYQAVKSTLEEKQIPFVSTHTICPTTNPGNFPPTPDFTPEANRLIARAVLEELDRHLPRGKAESRTPRRFPAEPISRQEDNLQHVIWQLVIATNKVVPPCTIHATRAVNLIELGFYIAKKLLLTATQLPWRHSLICRNSLT